MKKNKNLNRNGVNSMKNNFNKLTIEDKVKNLNLRNKPFATYEEFKDCRIHNQLAVSFGSNNGLLKELISTVVCASNPLKEGKPSEVCATLKTIFENSTKQSIDFIHKEFEKKLDCNFEEKFTLIVKNIIAELPDKNKYLDYYNDSCQHYNVTYSFEEFLPNRFISDIVEYCKDRYAEQIKSGKEPDKFYKFFGDENSRFYLRYFFDKSDRPKNTLLNEYKEYLSINPKNERMVKNILKYIDINSSSTVERKGNTYTHQEFELILQKYMSDFKSASYKVKKKYLEKYQDDMLSIMDKKIIEFFKMLNIKVDDIIDEINDTHFAGSDTYIVEAWIMGLERKDPEFITNYNISKNGFEKFMLMSEEDISILNTKPKERIALFLFCCLYLSYLFVDKKYYIIDRLENEMANGKDKFARHKAELVYSILVSVAREYYCVDRYEQDKKNS